MKKYELDIGTNKIKEIVAWFIPGETSRGRQLPQNHIWLVTMEPADNHQEFVTCKRF